MLSENISKVFVVSLPGAAERRRHIREHFSTQGIIDYEFVKATTPESDRVKELYRNSCVKPYPNCFRCNKTPCHCSNNVLIPQQVANWLSFADVWKKAAQNIGWTLICEDDVLFYENGISLLNKLMQKRDNSNKPQLIRLSQSGQDTHQTLSEVIDLQESQKRVMSNPAYLINQAMAKYLLSQFEVIDTTSDVWVHSTIASSPDIDAATVEPLIATELSFNKSFARFPSAIHPKGIDKDDAARQSAHIKRVESEAEYKKLLDLWTSPSPNRKRIDRSTDESFIQRHYEEHYNHKETREKWKSIDAKGNPIPWITYSALFQIERYDYSSSHIFEWGSGYSTEFWSKRSASVTTVDHDATWHDFAKRLKRPNTRYILSSLAEYSGQIDIANTSSKKYDVIVIDGYIHGSLRYHCAERAVHALAHGGFIVLDNSDWLPDTCAFFRDRGFNQADYAGFGPSNKYPWVTSIFSLGNITIPRHASPNPGFIAGGIQNIRD
ncbi:glycosyltransferase family 25 protein [Gilvimarinus sp. DA14]|uniref:glycosyltransferase family 25 protein n=1 Tax=Gilvimarinus sp. DA14 TaxID=2956798 RepID=UPI0020B7598E|nr:glycosyltransferase family 25 protein [Gilvimarinus sp. DA14]UTF59555.1 glycosyltransferase family 25 protein [Gilvimarinus sp. DA14]